MPNDPAVQAALDARAAHKAPERFDAEPSAPSAFATLDEALWDAYAEGRADEAEERESTPSAVPVTERTPGTYRRFKMLGVSDRGECDQCGKTNLRLTIVLETEGGDVLHYGSDCAAAALKQRYQGRRFPISREAVLSMARRAKTEAIYVEAA